MSKEFVISITDKSQWDTLPKTVEYIVLYTHYRDSLGNVCDKLNHSKFTQIWAI